MKRADGYVSAAWLAIGCALAMALAMTSRGQAVAQTPSPDAARAAGTPRTPGTEGARGAAAPALAIVGASGAVDLRHGRTPIFGGGLVPLEWMPPGTNASPVPSDRIFPPQQITIRFNHKKHVKELQQTCKVCHGAAYKSEKSSDSLLPNPAQTCDNCHDVNHKNLAAVKSGSEPNGQCTFCHLGDRAGENGRVAPVVLPQPNLRMNHAAHLRRNIDCAQCHGQIAELEFATREQLPRMAGCFACHAQSGPARGEARGHCTNCHLTEASGRMLTTFSTGELKPPIWLHGAAHTPDWIERHKGVAGANSELCASCHSTTFCNDCHDGRVRPRAVHPSDWISMHAEAARMDNPRCVSCHQLTAFCGDCHRRIGVARDAPSANRLGGRRFHLEPAIWTQAPRSAQHHAWEAERNLNACVACHTERDCATCHATKGLRGGAGVNPHPPGFASSCGGPFRSNPRPCLVCHTGDDFRVETCR